MRVNKIVKRNHRQGSKDDNNVENQRHHLRISGNKTFYDARKNSEWNCAKIDFETISKTEFERF